MKYHKLTIPAFVLPFVLLFCSNSFGQDKHWLSYEPAVVELTGQLRVIRKYGPPNFGENPKTDAKVKVPLLVLSYPINVRGNQNEFPYDVEVRGIKRIQLTITGLGELDRRLIGKNVIVQGTLFHAHTGNHYTPVVMEVKAIKLD